MADADRVPDLLAVALDVARKLNGLEIRYLVGGSLASSVHGEPRSTLDVDMVVDLRPAHLLPFGESLRPQYYMDLDAASDAVASGGSFNAVHVGSAVKVDFFVAGTDRFERERLRHRLEVRVGEAPDEVLFIDTPEHSLLRKLEWFRRGGEVSERQWRDVSAIVAVQGDRLDREQLALWASVLGVADLLQRLVDSR